MLGTIVSEISGWGTNFAGLLHSEGLPLNGALLGHGKLATIKQHYLSFTEAVRFMSDQSVQTLDGYQKAHHRQRESLPTRQTIVLIGEKRQFQPHYDP